MKKGQQYSDILSGKIQLGPYPMEKLRRVPVPTTKITGDIERFDERRQGFARAARGEYGKWKYKDPALTPAKDPLMPVYSTMIWNLPPVDEGVEVGIPSGMFMADKSRLSPPPTEPHPAARVLLEVNPEKAAIPEDPAVMSRNIKSAGYFFGADIMGICELPQWAVYSHNKAGEPMTSRHRYAIVVVADMGYKAIKASTGYDWIGGSGPQWAYLKAAFIATNLAAYIRRLGYPARVQHYQNYQVLITPLLLLAGIGELSRPNLVLNPFIGLRYKAAAVTTDLPLEVDMPVDFGLQDFCSKCMKCADDCPSRAISFGDKIMHNGYERWDFNTGQCTRMRVANPKGTGCGSCVHVCPWNKPKGWTHDVVRWLVAHTPLFNRAIVKMDGVMGYGHADERYRWQLDL